MVPINSLIAASRPFARRRSVAVSQPAVTVGRQTGSGDHPMRTGGQAASSVELTTHLQLTPQ